MKPVDFDYARAEDAAQAVTLLAGDEGAKVISGGQSLGPMLNLRLARPMRLVDLRNLATLRAVHDADDAIVYGAATRHVEFEDGLVPDAAQGMLCHVARGIAYRAVRNRGTIGGSLAHADPAADWVNTCLALDATLILLAAGGSRQLRARDFMLGAFTTALRDGEIITAVSIPKLSARARWGYYKICRKTGEFAEALGAVVVDPERGYCRVVLGATDGAPACLEDVADALTSKGAVNPSQLRDAVLAALPGASPVSLRHHETALKRAIAQVYPS